MIRTGVAGWDYVNWKGRVYPERLPKGFDKLAYLARYLDVFEINRTYYRPATVTEARSWIERLADRPQVVVTAKLPERFVAPGKSWTAEDVREARAGMDVMHERGRLAAVVLQFAYSFKRLNRDGGVDERSREWLRASAAAFAGLPVFVELRHASWDAPEVLDWLRERGIGWVNLDQPHLPRDAMPLTTHATTPLGYLRLHGRNYQTWLRGQGRRTAKTADVLEARQAKARTTEERARDEAQKDARFDYLYPRAEQAELAAAAREIAARPGVVDVIAVYNNHNLGKAPANALELAGLLGGTPVPAPPELFRAFEPELTGVARPVPVDQREGSR
jgi:uncharacterized protein YecE (DUF72 family)